MTLRMCRATVHAVCQSKYARFRPNSARRCGNAIAFRESNPERASLIAASGRSSRSSIAPACNLLARTDERLLLRRAMQRTEAEHQIARVDADDLATRKQVCDDTECDAILRITKGGDQHGVRRYVEVCITGRQALFCEHHRCRHG